MDAPAAAQPVSRLCPACFFCFSWKLAPDKSAAVQTEQKQEGSSPQVSYHCPKAAHSHTWMGQHQGCCYPENYGPLCPSVWLTHNSSQPGKSQTALGLGSLALLCWLTGVNLVMRRTGRLLLHNQSWACVCSLVLVSPLWRHFWAMWELPAAPWPWGHAVPGSSPVLGEEMVFSHHTELGAGSGGFCRLLQACSHWEQFKLCWLLSLGSALIFHKAPHLWGIKSVICRGLRTGPSNNFLKFVFISPYYSRGLFGGHIFSV